MTKHPKIPMFDDEDETVLSSNINPKDLSKLAKTPNSPRSAPSKGLVPGVGIKTPMTPVGSASEETKLLDQNQTPVHDASGDDINSEMTVIHGGVLGLPVDAKLHVIQGVKQGESLSLKSGTTSIGREKDNDHSLADLSMSRYHFNIIHDSGSYIMENRSAGNPTAVNGNKIKGKIKLVHGDHIQAGQTLFQFSEDGTTPDRKGSGGGSKMGLIIGGVVVLIAAAVGIYLFLQPPTPPTPPDKKIDVYDHKADQKFTLGQELTEEKDWGGATKAFKRAIVRAKINGAKSQFAARSQILTMEAQGFIGKIQQEQKVERAFKKAKNLFSTQAYIPAHKALKAAIQLSEDSNSPSVYDAAMWSLLGAYESKSKAYKKVEKFAVEKKKLQQELEAIAKQGNSRASRRKKRALQRKLKKVAKAEKKVIQQIKKEEVKQTKKENEGQKHFQSGDLEAAGNVFQKSGNTRMLKWLRLFKTSWRSGKRAAKTRNVAAAIPALNRALNYDKLLRAKGSKASAFTVEIKSKLASMYFNRGKYFQSKNQYGAAMLRFNKALKFKPGYSAAKKRKAKINGIFKGWLADAEKQISAGKQAAARQKLLKLISQTSRKSRLYKSAQSLLKQ